MASESPWRADLLLVRRFLVGRRLLTSLVVPFVITLVFTTLHWVAGAFALSGEQVAQRELGSHEHALDLAVEPGDLSVEGLAEAEQALRDAGVDDVALEITTTDALVDQKPRRGSGGIVRATTFVEPLRWDDAGVAELSDAYPLATGRWPAAAGEVVLSPALASQVRTDRLTLFAGATSLRVVGTVVDRFDTDSLTVLAAPGTWEAVPAEVARSFAPSAGLLVGWGGQAEPGLVESTLRSALALAPSPDGPTRVTKRSSLVAQHESSLSEDQALLFVAPLSVLAVLVGFSVSRANRRWAQGCVRRCRSIGLAPRRVGADLLFVLTVGVGVAALLGVAGGVLTGTALRSTLLPHVLTHPAGPVPSLGPLLAASLVMTGVAVSASALDLLLSTQARARVARVASVIPWNLTRRVLAGVALAKGAQAATRSGVEFYDLGGTGLLVVLATVLLAPDLLALASPGLRESQARTLLARRMIAADRGGLSLVSMVVAASVAFPIVVSTYNASARHSNDTGFASMVRPGELWVDGDMVEAAATADVVGDAVPEAERVDLLWTDAFVYPGTDLPSENTGIGAVATVEEFRALFADEPALDEMVDVITSGGIAFVEQAADRPVHDRSTEEARVLAVPVTGFELESPPAKSPFAGIMLSATLTDLEISAEPSSTIFLDLSQAEVEEAVAAVRAAGLDVRAVDFHRLGEPTPPSPQAYFALGGLLVLAGFLVVGLMRAAGDRMRDRAAQLLAVGLRRRWSASVAALQVGLAASAGLLAGALGAAAAIWVFVSAPSQVVLLSVPTRFVVTSLVTVVVLTGVGVVTCLTRVRFGTDAGVE